MYPYFKRLVLPFVGYVVLGEVFADRNSKYRKACRGLRVYGYQNGHSHLQNILLRLMFYTSRIVETMPNVVHDGANTSKVHFTNIL